MIEKPLKAVHLIPFTNSDSQWVYENVDVSDKLLQIIKKIEEHEGVDIIERDSEESGQENFSQTESDRFTTEMAPV